jgi:hypothetical protein
MAIHLVSYANARMYGSLRRLGSQAAALPFDHVHLFRDTDLQQIPEFWERHREHIEKNPRGAGYWIWKPYVILLALKCAAPGDVVFFVDAGCSLVAERAARLLEYAELVRAHSVLNFALGHSVRRWTKMDTVLAYDGVAYLDRPQILSGVIGICNTPAGNALVAEWYEGCCNYHLADDTPSGSPNDPEFIEHRHDQAILTMISYNRNAHVIADESYPVDSPDSGPILATRVRIA